MKRLCLLLLPLASFAAAPSPDWAPNATGTAAWLWNVSNGAAAWDRIGTLQLGADIVASSRYDVSRTDAAHLTLHLAGDWYPRYKKLNRGLLGGRVDWQHRFGTGDFAPVFTVEGTGDFIASVESARRGTVAGVNVKLHQRFGRTWRAALIHRFEQYYAKRSVFDSSSGETTLELARDFGESTRLSISGRWRQGDIVTYARFNRPDLVALSHDRAALSTFRLPMTAYAIEARTVGGRVALVHATAEDSAVVLAYEYAMTTKSDLKFANPVLSLSFVRQY